MKKLYVMLVGALFTALLLTGCKSLPGSPVDSAPLGSSPADDAGLPDPGHGDSTAGSHTTTTGVHPADTVDSTTGTAVTAAVATEPKAPSSTAQPSGTQTATTAHTHTWTKQVIAPTCEGEGYTIRRCSCGKQEETDRRMPLGHAWSDWMVKKAATKTEAGQKVRSCDTCKKEQTATIDKLPQTVSDIQQEVYRLVNAQRTAQGLAPLIYYTAGQAAADIRAQELETQFSHTRPDGSSCFTALDEQNVHYVSAGENIAYGYTTPAQVMDGWMNSTGHRANILGDGFNAIIVGYNPDCNGWVQLFLTVYEH